MRGHPFVIYYKCQDKYKIFRVDLGFFWFNAGVFSFDYVIILSSERQHLNKIKKEKLLFFTADDLTDFLDMIKADSSSTESTFLGYKVKISFEPLSKKETEIREESLARVVLNG
ncbi:hypothetical protein BHECKSOX2_1441 [Bathymodiolus heckerae thiotrophic gill symbiont]|uniref:hypothetical protein n=1 Tax=Bathymodiolus heckerae thiotrophic gill symbiont TaxID=1052212 RepID=UPI0010B30A21|nr:hypothetical protein [Bathymodiolus heckerae thiotrophic gill symbiont]SMN14124.1 hypothetical protein BHECKSOX2_1441 [Bathymodiolus heckerae thiotrophic gill symbiont]